MQEYYLWIVLAAWGFMVLLKRLTLKKGRIEVVTFVLFGLGIIALEYWQIYPIDSPIIIGASLLGFGLTLLFFNVDALRQRDRDMLKLLALKKEVKEMHISYESLRKRFIAMIEMMKDGIVFRSDDGTMFGTDRFLEITELNSNELTQEEYEHLIHSEDLASYRTNLNKLSKKNTHYEMSYRIRRGNQYGWLKEQGTIVYYEDRKMIISFFKPIDVKRYPQTQVELLNRLQIDHECAEQLQILNRMRKPYHIVYIELKNIPSINKMYGRDIGDLMMGEFLNKLIYHFIKDEHSIFRLSGIRFAMLVKDERKYEILERALKHGGDLLNFSMVFGNINQNVYPYFGIQQITEFSEPIDEIMTRTDKALDIALSSESPENYFVIG